MSSGRLLQHFNQVSEAPDAVPRLRRFILDLAVRGKLVEQDPADEPAAKLLKRIEAEKVRLIRVGEIRKPKPQSLFNGDDVPFPLPKTWLWVRLGDVFDYDAGTKTEPRQLPRDAWLLELEDIEKDSGKVIQRFTVDDRSPKSTKSGFQPGDVLYGKLRPYLNKAAVADSRGFSTTEIVALRCYGESNPRYTCLALRRPDFVEYVTRLGQGTKMPRLRTEDAISALFPLPPLAEQHRIVAKVDELMVLCDELEMARSKREKRRDRLVAATLHGLNNGDASPESDTHSTFEESARSYFNHLPRLTTRPEHIHQLRQTILNLAVRGKLVPQDPNDEPASGPLKRIEVEKQRLIASGRIGKHETLPTVSRGETPFEEPSGWTWARLLSLCEVITKGSSPRWQGVAYTDKKDGVLFITSENVGNFRLFLENRKYVQKKFNEIEPRSILARNDILLNLVGASIGRSALFELDEIANINQAVCIVRTISRGEQLNLRYLLLFLNSEFSVRYMLDKQVDMARANLSMTNVGLAPVPLPPLAEQHRIVAKVDELMALCDELDARLTTTATTRRQLLEATLQEALNNHTKE